MAVWKLKWRYGCDDPGDKAVIKERIIQMGKGKMAGKREEKTGGKREKCLHNSENRNKRI